MSADTNIATLAADGSAFAGATVADLVEAISDAFPAQWAEPWDRVGLLAGDSAAPAMPVLVTLDPTQAALDRAVELGARTLLTHHPAFLTTPEPVAGRGPAGVVFRALRQGIALVAAHTNLDRSPAGGDALPLAVGLAIVSPLERSTQVVDLVTVFVPASDEETVVEAMAAAGAGRLGNYEASSFSAPGEGTFTPREGAEPAAGTWEVTGAMHNPEHRVEMAAPAGTGSAVAQAARAVHPYEEPLIVVTEAHIARGAARLGRLCEPSGHVTLAELAAQVGIALSCTPRFWGEADLQVGLVATAPGSGSSLVADAVSCGADVILTGELRYHDALKALDAGLAVIEAGHDATEWPLVPILASAALRTPALMRADVVVDERRTLWRTA